MLLRLKADVEATLRPKHETILFTGMSVLQKKLYRDNLLRDIDVVQGQSEDRESRTAILTIVMQLRRCAGTANRYRRETRRIRHLPCSSRLNHDGFTEVVGGRVVADAGRRD